MGLPPAGIVTGVAPATPEWPAPRGRGRAVDPRLVTNPEADLLGVPEAARLLDRSTEQVRRYLREGRLRGRRIGNQWFIEAAALAEFRGALGDGGAFLARIPPSDELDPLAETIGIGRGGGRGAGGAIAEGKDEYRRAYRPHPWRR